MASSVSRVAGDESAVATEVAGGGGSESRATSSRQRSASCSTTPHERPSPSSKLRAVELLPARARCDAGVHLFGVLLDAAPDLARREVLLDIDDGMYWFELRGISVRGVARRVDSPESGAARRLTWYAIEPRRVLAWDYGAIREE